MRKEYEEEWGALRKRMDGAEKFAEKLPIFSKQILENKNNETDTYISFGYIYKNIPLKWGIKRLLYNGNTRLVTNAKSINYPIYLFNIYINCINLFGDDFYDFCRKELLKITFDVLHFDVHNTTLYATDKQIEPLLERLSEWYIAQIEEINVDYKKRKIERLREELEKLENDKKI